MTDEGAAHVQPSVGRPVAAGVSASGDGCGPKLTTGRSGAITAGIDDTAGGGVCAGLEVGPGLAATPDGRPGLGVAAVTAKTAGTWIAGADPSSRAARSPPPRKADATTTAAIGPLRGPVLDSLTPVA